MDAFLFVSRFLFVNFCEWNSIQLKSLDVLVRGPITTKKLIFWIKKKENTKSIEFRVRSLFYYFGRSGFFSHWNTLFIQTECKRKQQQQTLKTDVRTANTFRLKQWSVRWWYCTNAVLIYICINLFRKPCVPGKKLNLYLNSFVIRNCISFIWV